MKPASPFADPRFLKALRGLEAAIALQRKGRAAEADAAFARLVKKNPHYFDALHLYGLFKCQQGKPAEALPLIAKATKVNPRSAEALNSLGVVYGMLDRHAEALSSFDSALAIKPDHVAALGNRGNSLNEFGRYLDTVATTDRALSIDPGHVETYIPRGAALLRLKRYDEALSSYRQAIERQPMNATAWLGCGNVHYELKQYEQAVAAFDQALRLKPDIDNVWDVRLYSKLNLCDWTTFDSDCAHVLKIVRERRGSVDPSILMDIPSSAQDKLTCAKQRGVTHFPPSNKPLWRGERYQHDRIRVAYLSADFHEHPVAFLTAGLFEAHDRSRFETVGLSFAPDDGSAMRARLKNAFEEFIDVSAKTEKQIAELLRAREIDIAVDLMGFTRDARTDLYTLRPAPIQVNYLGYPGTMGAAYIDYIIADRILIPEAEQQYYVEKIVYMPDTFQATDRSSPISEKAVTRMGAGLPSNGFVYCCFNANYKITPGIFDSWMRILKQVDGSVLWLSPVNAVAADNLRREATRRGIDAGRLIFAPRIPLREHQARLRLADLFLDTLPFGAGATATGALWAGLPVLTRIGESFAGRMSASLLNAVGLPELVTTSAEAYEALAIELASQPGKITALKSKLANNRLTMPLFDTERFTRHIEAAYTTMWQCQQRGELPQAFAVTRID